MHHPPGRGVWGLDPSISGLEGKLGQVLCYVSAEEVWVSIVFFQNGQHLVELETRSKCIMAVVGGSVEVDEMLSESGSVELAFKTVE